MTKKGRQIFSRKNGWHPSVAAPGDTNPSDATVLVYIVTKSNDSSIGAYNPSTRVGMD